MDEQTTESDKASLERISDFDGFEIEETEESSKANGSDVQIQEQQEDYEFSKYTKPKLRESIKNRILRGTKGGKAGEWSARKAQLLVQAYEKAGGGYKGGKSKSQASLKKWGKEKWTTSDGKPSLRKGKDKRYLPERVWKKLKPAEKSAANRAKAEGSKKGDQFVPNTPAVKKAFSYNGKTFEL